MRRLKKSLPWIALLVLVTTYLPIYNPSDAAAVMQRGEDDAWIHKEGTPLKFGWHWDVPLQTTAGSTSFWPDGELSEAQTFPISRVWILNRSEGFFSREFGREIQRRLMKDPHLWEVAYFPAGDLPLKIRRPPHVFITYAVDQFHESHGPIWHRWDADVQVQVGRAPFALTPGRMGDAGDPGRMLDLHFATTGIGWTTRAVRFDHGIGIMMDRLDPFGLVQAWRGNNADQPELPLEWAGGPPTPPSDWDWLNALNPQRIASQAPAPLLEQHAWIVPSPEGSNPLASLRQTLDAAGFATGLDFDGKVLNARSKTLHVTAHHPNPDSPTELAIQSMQWPTSVELADWVQQVSPEESTNWALWPALRRQPLDVRDALREELLRRELSAAEQSVLRSLPTTGSSAEEAR